MDDVLREQLTSYLRDPDVVAALFVSADGFLVAGTCHPDIDCEAIAAQVAAVLSAGKQLAGELGQTTARYFTFELDDLNLLAAPFDHELLLVLVGRPKALKLSYSVRSGT